MSYFVSKKVLTKENRMYKRNSIIMKKTKLPTQAKTKRTTCPQCSKRGFSKVLGNCIKCKFILSPGKMFTIKKANEV